MADQNHPSRERLDRLIAELPFDPSESTIEDCLDTIRDLQEVIESLEAETHAETAPRQSTGVMGNDEYNSLLEVYPKPRQTTDSGPLAGVTFAVKDNIAAKDLAMTCAVTDFRVVPSYDATVVERLLSAGAVLVGKNNMEPFAMGPTGENSEFGPVRNPVVPGGIPGGSSSGSGAAVAGGIVDASLGTDTGGSVRIPAACCGVVGVKPTHRLVPRFGLVDLMPTTDTIGPIARDVHTAAKLLEAIAGYDSRDPSSSRIPTPRVVDDLGSVPDVTLGVVTSLTEPAATPVREATYSLVHRLERHDAITVREVDRDLSEVDLGRLYSFLAVEFAWLIRQGGIFRGQGTGYQDEWRAAFQRYVAEHEMNDYIVSRILPGAYADAVTNGRAYTLVRNAITAFQDRLDSVFEEVDALVMPTMRILPPDYDDLDTVDPFTDIGGNTVPFSLAGTPAVSVPIASENDRPISVQLVTPAFQDTLALQLARHIESLGPPAA